MTPTPKGEAFERTKLLVDFVAAISRVLLALALFLN